MTTLPHPAPPVEILLPVHNAWHVLRPCLESVDRFTSYPRLELTILDDGSDPFVAKRLAEYAHAEAAQPRRLVRSERQLGFVRTANRGLRFSRADLVVLLNSDTIVTPGWLERLVRVALSDERIACVMPMSNWCALHSVDVPMGWNIFQYAADLGRHMKGTGFDLVTASAFCLLMKRAALEEIGCFDEAFGVGYGEESDWCMRALAQRWRVVGSEDVFVYHRGNASFGDFKERNFRKGNYQLFMDRWGEAYGAAMARYYEANALAQLRDAYVRPTAPSSPPLGRAFLHRFRTGGMAHALNETRHYVRDQGGWRRVRSLARQKGIVRRKVPTPPMPRGFQSAERPRVTYVLEKFSLSGGVLSVVQLVNRLILLGWDAKIATHHEHDQSPMRFFEMYHQPYIFPSVPAMIENFPPSDIVVATLWSTAFKVHRIASKFMPHAVPWYYIQDDETRFFRSNGRKGADQVLRSYGLIPNRIVKTDWLRGILARRGYEAEKIPLGMNLDLFYPEDRAGPERARLLALTRPDTPRRGFEQLIRVMREIKSRRPGLEICLVGCANLANHRPDFEHVDLGIVAPEKMRAVYASSSAFLDTSVYQGFGRMGLEAMACGCAAVLSGCGGVNEYARDGENCLLIDPLDSTRTADLVLKLLDTRPLREALKREGLRTASQFSADLEARRTSQLFAESLGFDAAVAKRTRRYDQKGGAVDRETQPAPWVGAARDLR